MLKGDLQSIIRPNLRKESPAVFLLEFCQSGFITTSLSLPLFFFSTAICWEPWWMGGMYEWLSLFIGHRRKCCRDRTQTRDLVTLHLMHTISGRFIMSCVTLTADPFHLATHTHTHTRRNKCVLISHHVSAAFITESSSDKYALMSAS